MPRPREFFGDDSGLAWKQASFDVDKIENRGQQELGRQQARKHIGWAFGHAIRDAAQVAALEVEDGLDPDNGLDGRG